MAYATLLLDLDHTLVDSETSELLAFGDTMASIGIEDAEQYFADYTSINRSYWAAVERGEITPDQVRVARFREFIGHFGIDADPEVMAATFVAGLGAHGELYSGATEVLDQLHDSVPMGLVTNGLSDVQRTRIARLDIEHYFQTIVISGEVGVSKPGTAIFDFAFAGLGSPSRDTALMVGDSLSSDIQGAANYGIAGCWYNPARRTAGSDVPIAHEIAALSDLPAVVVGPAPSIG
jgi:YjjG family noncanonical pyrimidine nucleotidase